ncbi:MAG: class I SAM-dependent methyltransferase [Negativicutes bacterium]
MFYRLAGSGLLYNLVIRKMIPAVWRQKCAAMAQGRVLEVGVGTGLMLPFYGSAATEVVGIDLSSDMLDQAAQISSGFSFPVRLKQMDVEALRLEAGVFDTVVSAFVFCSVDHPLQGLSECRRVLRPGGRMIFIEHVGSQKWWVSAFLKLLNPLSVLLLGDHLTRDTVGIAREAGFRIDRVERLYGDLVILAVGTVEE